MYIRLMIAAIVLVMLSTGCSQTGSGQRTLEVALWDEEASDAVNRSIELFNEKHPDVRVNVTYSPFGQYWTRLRTSIGGGSGPDVFWMNAVNFYQYAEPGLIKNLEPFIAEDEEFQKDDYYENIVELYSYDEQLHAAPYFVDAVGLFYNKEIFDQAGIDYPDETWTWDDIERVGELLTDPEEGIYGYGAPITSNQTGYYNYIHQAGGFIVSDDQLASGFDSEEAREAIHFIETLVKNGISPDIKSQIETGLNQLFLSDRLAMIPAISVMSRQFSEALGDRVDVAPLPKGKEEAAIIHGIGWAMNDRVEDEQLAWDLIKALTSESGNQQIAESGFSTPALLEAGDLWLESLPNINLRVFLEAQETGVAYPVSNNTAEWQHIEQTEIQGAFLGQKSLDQALDQVADEMNRILEQAEHRGNETK